MFVVIFAPPPPWGGMVLATSKKTKDKELPLGAYPPIAREVAMVVEGVCLLVVLIGRCFYETQLHHGA